jgi:hypothetical protein
MTHQWHPANRTERQLAWALASRDLPRYLRILSVADLWQPLGPVGGDGPAGRRLVTIHMRGTPVLPVFTSQEAMETAVSDVAEAAVLTRYRHLRDSWPALQWRLAVDPGLPIEAHLPVGAVDRAPRDRVPPADPDITVGSLWGGQFDPWPAGPHEALLRAVSIGDAAEFLDALLDCPVTLATAREVTGPLEPPGPDFPWRPAGPPQAPTIEVFTDQDAFHRAYPGVPRVTVRFAMLLPGWPGRHALSVNPGGPAGLDLPAPHLPRLRRWGQESAGGRVEARVPPEVLDGMRWARERSWPPVRSG